MLNVTTYANTTINQANPFAMGGFVPSAPSPPPPPPPAPPPPPPVESDAPDVDESNKPGEAAVDNSKGRSRRKGRSRSSTLVSLDETNQDSILGQ